MYHASIAFKGAMALQPWKLYPVRVQDERLQPASKEPWLFSHGCSMVPRQRYHLTYSALQWSHGFSAMDAKIKANALSMALSAFNGAMAFQPWMHLRFDLGKRQYWSLQWSHGFSAMDARPASSSCRPPKSTFNGAMAFQPWMPRTGTRTRSRRRSSFNGAMAEKPWMRDMVRSTIRTANDLQWSHG